MNHIYLSAAAADPQSLRLELEQHQLQCSHVRQRLWEAAFRPGPLSKMSVFDVKQFGTESQGVVQTKSSSSVAADVSSFNYQTCTWQESLFR